MEQQSLKNQNLTINENNKIVIQEQTGQNLIEKNNKTKLNEKLLLASQPEFITFKKDANLLTQTTESSTTTTPTTFKAFENGKQIEKNKINIKKQFLSISSENFLQNFTEPFSYNCLLNNLNNNNANVTINNDKIA